MHARQALLVHCVLAPPPSPGVCVHSRYICVAGCPARFITRADGVIIVATCSSDSGASLCVAGRCRLPASEYCYPSPLRPSFRFSFFLFALSNYQSLFMCVVAVPWRLFCHTHTAQCSAAAGCACSSVSRYVYD